MKAILEQRRKIELLPAGAKTDQRGREGRARREAHFVLHGRGYAGAYEECPVTSNCPHSC